MIQEDQLIKEALLGSQSAFKSLYEIYKKAMFTICLRYNSCREEAEDALQEGFIKVFNQLDMYNPDKGKFFSWISKIMVNTNLEMLRKKKIKWEEIDSIEVKEQVHDDYNILSSLQVKEIIKSMQAMPHGYRVVFNLYFFEGFNHKEVAEYLNVTESTSKTQLHKAKIFIRSRISDQMNILKV